MSDGFSDGGSMSDEEFRREWDKTMEQSPRVQISKLEAEVKRLKGALRAWNVWARGLLGKDDGTGLREGALREELGNAYARKLKEGPHECEHCGFHDLTALSRADPSLVHFCDRANRVIRGLGERKAPSWCPLNRESTA